VKIAVISNPQTGYNSNDPFFPCTGTNKYEVRRWKDDVAVFTGTFSSERTSAKGKVIIQGTRSLSLYPLKTRARVEIMI